jgi:hypothetical protein
MDSQPAPSTRTISSLAGRVMLRRGEMLIPDNTLGASSFGLAVPRAASPLRINGDAFSIRIW